MPRRLLPDRAFPPYSFIGRGHGFPHPRNEPGGHARDLPEPEAEPLDLEAPHQCVEHLWGIDLFHHGYYWEAHEAWESVWFACGRRGDAAELLRGLILLAAAGVKARQGRPSGVRRLALGARRRFETLLATRRRAGGLDLEHLARFASRIAENADSLEAFPNAKVAVVFDEILGEPEAG